MQTSEKSGKLSRRGLLQAAGGVTFLALTPRALTPRALGRLASEPSTGHSVSGGDPYPLFTALPYLQPGPNGSRLVDGQESIVIAWQTNKVPATFALTYGPAGTEQTAEIVQGKRWSGDQEDGETNINYVATLKGLKLDTRYRYRVTMNGEKFLEGYFTTRKPRGAKVRFVAFGDNSFGEISDRQIAFQAYKAMPDFVMNTGDNVYESGLDNEYTRYFFPVYNADQAGPRLGAPLLRSVPFYTVLANHDVHSSDAHKHPVADFNKYPDALAYYTNMHLPLNGPAPKYPTPTVGPDETLSGFKALAGPKYPTMANYSFDYGDAHFLCLDSNVYIDPTDEALMSWIDQDLGSTDAAWKFVVYHHPAFNVGDEHYHEQHMRVFTPLFEKHGVDMVLNGHEHTYQRTRPLKFVPGDLAEAKAVGGKTRLVPGAFTVDTKFDGKATTKADGIVYVTTGAGGKHLYDADLNSNPERWRHEEDGNVEYVVRFVSDRHSLTVFDMDPHRLTMRQIDEWGREIDHVTFTKA